MLVWASATKFLTRRTPAGLGIYVKKKSNDPQRISGGRGGCGRREKETFEK